MKNRRTYLLWYNRKDIVWDIVLIREDIMGSAPNEKKCGIGDTIIKIILYIYSLLDVTSFMLEKSMRNKIRLLVFLELYALNGKNGNSLIENEKNKK